MGFTPSDVYFTSRDGLRLHASVHTPTVQGPVHTPVLCLAGLTRNARDFTALAEDLSNRGYTVISADYRGRGLSEYDHHWRNYTPLIEAYDVTDLLARLNVHKVHIVGTSRGGLIAMILAVMRPTGLASAVLNDIGPVIERDGLARIIGYVGRVPVPHDWAEAEMLVRDINKGQFQNVPDEDWAALARQWFNEEDGLPVAGYDPNLSRAFTNVDLDTALPDLWRQFKALSRFPVMTLRGENSDILGRGTVAAMQDMHPAMVLQEVPGQGHAPLLRDRPTLDAVAEFLDSADDAGARV